MRVVRSIGAVALTAACCFAFASAPAAASSHGPRGTLTFRSARGDYIGGGTTQHYRAGTRRGVVTTMTVSTLYTRDNSIQVWVKEGDYTHSWYLLLAAPDGHVLTAGRYKNAQREPFKAAGHPGLSFFGDGRGCNELYGEFTVRRLERASDGSITKLDVSFEQHCERPDAPALRGHLRFSA